MKKYKYGKMRLLCEVVSLKCREKGKYDLYGKLIKKYNIDERKLEEAYYD